MSKIIFQHTYHTIISLENILDAWKEFSRGKKSRKDVQEFLWDRLRLTMHPNKISIETLASGVDFLGWVHFPHHRVLRTATKRRMFANRRIYVADEAVVNSYKGLLSHGNGYKLVRTIEDISANVPGNLPLFGI